MYIFIAVPKGNVLGLKTLQVETLQDTVRLIYTTNSELPKVKKKPAREAGKLESLCN